MKYSALVILSLVVANGSAAQEICGLQQARYDQPDLMLRNGFEGNTLAQTRDVTGGGGLGPPLTVVNSPALGVTPTISITSPASGAAIDGAVQVQGTFTGPANTGITVLGVPATVIGNQFVSEPLQLTAGSVSINVRAKTIDGLSATQTINVNVVAAPASDLGISLSSAVGFAPFRLKPRISARGVTGIQSVAIDFNGDGSNDYTGAVETIPIYVFASPGVYRLRVILTTPSQTLTRFRTLAVPSVPETRARACSVYAHLRTRLAANDSVGALQAIAQPLRGQMAELFSALGANRPAFATRLGTIANGIFTPTNAEMMLVNEVGADLHGATMHLTRGSDGVWRIDSL